MTPAARRRPSSPSARPPTTSARCGAARCCARAKRPTSVAARIGLQPIEDARLMETDAGDWTEPQLRRGTRRRLPSASTRSRPPTRASRSPAASPSREQEQRVGAALERRRSGRAAGARGLPRHGHPCRSRAPLRPWRGALHAGAQRGARPARRRGGRARRPRRRRGDERRAERGAPGAVSAEDHAAGAGVRDQRLVGLRRTADPRRSPCACRRARPGPPRARARSRRSSRACSAPAGRSVV